MNKELLIKYCNNNCTEEELKSVLAWFEDSAGTPEGKSLLFKMWEDGSGEDDNPDIDFDLLLDRIHHEVNLTQSKKLLHLSDQDLIKYKRKENFLKTLVRGAAMLLLPALGFGLYMSVKYQTARNGQASVNQTYNEVFSSVDAITKVSLPDGSNVWLNHSSSLRYPAVFQGGFRNVELKGEGYFEVTHNSKVPFVVSVEKIQIIALGTTFNVMAYPDENRIETSLISGKVDIKKSGKDKKTVTIYSMKPTDMTIYNKESDEVLTKTIVDDRYFSWKDGRLIFTAEPMEDVVKKLSRWFNVDIEIKDPELKGLTLTATFVHETLPQVMELLSFVSPVSYTILDRKINTDGNFSRRKIILSYRRL
jgi:transmembrane sensor